MCESSRSAVRLEGEKSDLFNVEQGVAQGCSSSPILFSVFTNDLLKEVEQAEIGIQLISSKKVGGMLFTDDYVGVSSGGSRIECRGVLSILRALARMKFYVLSPLLTSFPHTTCYTKKK